MNLCHQRWFSMITFVCVVSWLCVEPCHTQSIEQTTIAVNVAMQVNEAGNARFQATFSFSPPRIYDRVKRAYPNLYVLFRDFINTRAAFEIERDTLKISSDDGRRTITVNADVLGAAVCKRNRWYIGLDESETVVTVEDNKVFTTFVDNRGAGQTFTGTFNYILPPSAREVNANKERGLLAFTLPPPRLTGEPSVDAVVRYKKRLMSAVYKVYADPEVENGGYWVAKTIIRNTGKAPLYDLRIYYKLGEYSDMSVPERYTAVMPGGAVVDLYYPVIFSKVAQLKTQTPTQLYVRYEYKDANGKTYSEEIAERLYLLGVNQFEFSNLSDDDKTDSWFDHFNNAPLLSAFVTRVDDAVKQFAGYVSEASGGAAAASKPDDAVRWLKAAYELQLANNIVYQTPSGFMTPDKSAGQDIKYPRDVFRDKSGTCVDLAITYAALAEAVGLRSYLMLIPGHCFAIIELPGGKLQPVENTGLGGGNQRMTFEQAMKVGEKEFQEAVQKGEFYLVDVKRYLTQGRIPNPELPSVEADFLDKAGIKRLNKPIGAVPPQDTGGVRLPTARENGGVRSVSPGKVELLEGTKVRVELIEELSSRRSKKGQEVRCVVKDDVLGPNKEAVIKKGALATGVVTEVKSAGGIGIGKNGKLEFTLESVTAVDGTIVLLRAQQKESGKGGVRGTLGNLLKGTNVTLPKGATFEVYVDKTVEVAVGSAAESRRAS